MIIFIIIAVIIILAHAIWDSEVIKKHNGLKGIKKAFHIGVLWLSLLLCMWIVSHDMYGTWIGMINLLPFTLLLVWLVKDASMGIILYQNPFYLGSGRWDTFWKKCPPLVLIGIKLSFLFLFYFLHAERYVEGLRLLLFN